MKIQIGDTPKQLAQGLMFDGEVWTKERIQALQAQVEQLRDAMQDLMNFQVKNLDVWHNAPYDHCYKLLKSTPAQCLAERNTEVAKVAFIAGVNYAHKRPDVILPKVIEMVAFDYVAGLRQAAKGDE
jgi:hypothetical protein